MKYCIKVLSQIIFGIIFFTGISANGLLAQQITGFSLDEHPDRKGILGNSITDMLWWNGTLYAGTAFGLSATSDNGQFWKNFTPADYGGQGGISALTNAPDGTIWIATAYDTTVQDDQELPIGGGLRFLPPGGTEWQYIPQPVDSRDDTTGGKSPTTTRVQNLTYDIAAGNGQVWIASFGGGVRRSPDMGQTWEVITTDGLPFSALNFLNHRGFSVLIENNTVWVGTADGVSKSDDGGNTWQRFTHQNQEQSISGNWVIALAHNPYDNSVWAATLRTNDPEEFNAISRTKNGGITWQIFLKDELSDGTFPRYFAFYDSAVYVATEKGIYKTIDDGQTWFRLPTIYDEISGEQIYSQTFYSVATSPGGAPNHRLWAGSDDGLAMTENNGYSWTIFRNFVSTRERPEPGVYAYPNPYSPTRHATVRFQFHIEEAVTVNIDIFNFAMEKVTTLTSDEAAVLQNTFDRSINWNGLDSNYRMVDNGVYFFRAKIGNRVSWGKIIIIN